MRFLLSASGAAWLVAVLSVAPGYATSDDAGGPVASSVTAQQRMLARFPQPVRVGDLIGVPLLDDSARTLGFVRQVVRTPQGQIEFIVSYGGWFGWDARPVAVPIEVVGIAGRHLSSLDMPRSEFAAAPTWRHGDETALADGDTIRVALSRH